MKTVCDRLKINSPFPFECPITGKKCKYTLNKTFEETFRMAEPVPFTECEYYPSEEA